MNKESCAYITEELKYCDLVIAQYIDELIKLTDKIEEMRLKRTRLIEMQKKLKCV